MAHEVLTLSKINPENQSTVLNVTIEGDSDMPFWNHDLKVKAILMLLNSIDAKDYNEANKHEEAIESAEEIINLTKAAFGLDFFEE